MGFTIVNEDDAADLAQSDVDAVDLGILASGSAGTGVVSGCAVSALGSPALKVHVAAGVAAILGAAVSVSAIDLDIGAADTIDRRFDLVIVDVSGVPSILAGTPDADAVFAVPSLPNVAVLAAVDITANATAISSAAIVDKRVPVTIFEVAGAAAAAQSAAATDATTKAAAAQAAAIAASQPADSDLTAIAALATTSFGRALLALADAAAGRTAFGLGTASTQASTDFDAAGAAAAAQSASQPVDSDLTAIAALATTSYGRAFLALADAAAGRTTLGLGTAATHATGDYDAAGAAAAALAAAESYADGLPDQLGSITDGTTTVAPVSALRVGPDDGLGIANNGGGEAELFVTAGIAQILGNDNDAQGTVITGTADVHGGQGGNFQAANADGSGGGGVFQGAGGAGIAGHAGGDAVLVGGKGDAGAGDNSQITAGGGSAAGDPGIASIFTDGSTGAAGEFLGSNGADGAVWLAALRPTNNLSDLANAATARTNLGAAPTASPTFTGTVTVPTPSGGTDAATKAYVDGVAAGLNVKGAARLATAAALPTNAYVAGVLTATGFGALTVDGSAVAASDRILVKNEAAQANNGLYVVTATGSGAAFYVLTRTSDMNTGAEVPGAFAFVEAGSTNIGQGFVVAGAGPYTLGTTAIVWTQFSGVGDITAGTGLTKTGNTLSVLDSSATPQAIGTASAGTNTHAPSADDHVHATGAGTPTTSAVGDAAAAGAGPAAANTNHMHGREAFAAPVAVGGANATGAAVTVNHSDHVHQSVGNALYLYSQFR